MIRELTSDEREELAKAVLQYDEAVANKKAVLDRLMLETSSIKVGDLLFTMDGISDWPKFGGVVEKLYRYWDGQRRPDLDSSYYAKYEYETQKNCFDNTSRRSIFVLGIAEMIQRFGVDMARQTVLTCLEMRRDWIEEALNKHGNSIQQIMEKYFPELPSTQTEKT